MSKVTAGFPDEPPRASDRSADPSPEGAGDRARDQAPGQAPGRLPPEAPGLRATGGSAGRGLWLYGATVAAAVVLIVLGLPVPAALVLVAGFLLEVWLDRLRTRRMDEVLGQSRRELAASSRRERRTGERLRLLEKAVETMSLGVSITDRRGILVSVNPADARMHGWTVDELLGRSVRVYSDDLGPLEPRRFSEGGPWERERWNVTKDGRRFPVRLLSDQVRGEDGRVLGTVTVCEDITEQRRVREVLARRERLQEAATFAAERFFFLERWQDGIEEVLDTLGSAFAADQLHLVELPGPRPAAGEAGQSVDAGELPELSAHGWSPRRSLARRIVLLEDEHLQLGTWSAALERGAVLERSAGELPTALRRVGVASGWRRSEEDSRAVAVVPVLPGGALWGLLVLTARPGDEGWPVAELETLKEVTRALGTVLERRAASRALERSEAHYRELIEGASDLIQSIDAEGRIRFVNTAWCKLLGYRPDEAIGLSLWEVIHPEHRERCARVLERLFERAEGPQEGSARIETVFLGRTGQEVVVDGRVVTRREEGEPVQTLGIFRDITEQQRIETLKQEFLSTVSHELRTPLTSLIGSLGLLTTDELEMPPERSRELLQLARRNGERLLRLVNDLLDLQKLAAGRLRLKPREVPLGDLVEDALEGIRGMADSFQVTLESRVEEGGALLHTDRERVVQVLFNLLSNGIKFSPPGARVSLRARPVDTLPEGVLAPRGASPPPLPRGPGHRPGSEDAGGDGPEPGAPPLRGWVELEIEDSGAGIPLEFQSRLYEWFAQADSSPTRPIGGSGLGLAITRSLLERLGGAIRLESEVGRGTKARLWLPRRLGGGEGAGGEVGGGAREPRALSGGPRGRVSPGP